MITDTGCAAVGTIERILEISAEAQIRRRCVASDSAAYLALTQEIAACGKALEALCHNEARAWQPRLTRHSELQLLR